MWCKTLLIKFGAISDDARRHFLDNKNDYSIHIRDNASVHRYKQGHFIHIFIRSTVPPENMTISKKIINVTVDTIPETVTCNAKALPEPTFRWFREGSTDIIVEGRVLDLKVPIPRRSNGTYYCEASNRHGTKNISLIMNVQCK